MLSDSDKEGSRYIHTRDFPQPFLHRTLRRTVTLATAYSHLYKIAKQRLFLLFEEHLEFCSLEQVARYETGA